MTAQKNFCYWLVAVVVGSAAFLFSMRFPAVDPPAAASRRNEMHVFYYNSKTSEGFDAEAHKKLTKEEAIAVFETLTLPESFFGIVLRGGHTLQFYIEDNEVFSVEVLNSDTLAGRKTTLDRLLVKEAIVAAYEGKDIEAELAGRFLKWENFKL